MERAEERLSWRWKNGIKNYSMQLRRRVAFEKQQNSEKRKVNCMFFLHKEMSLKSFSSPPLSNFPYSDENWIYQVYPLL